MSTIRDVALSGWLYAKLVIAIFMFGSQLVYAVGPLIIGAFVTVFGLAAFARYVLWPMMIRVYCRGVWATRRLFGPRVIVTPAPTPFIHPVPDQRS